MPDSYSAAERVEIERRVIEGLQIGRTLSELCREEGMPDRVTIYRWRDEDEVLAQRIARARDAGFDAIAEEALAIMDEEPERVVTITGEDRSESRIDSASVQWAFRRAELRLKLLAKWDPKRYGERQLIGSDPENPLPTGFNVNLVKPNGATPG